MLPGLIYSSLVFLLFISQEILLRINNYNHSLVDFAGLGCLFSLYFFLFPLLLSSYPPLLSL